MCLTHNALIFSSPVCLIFSSIADEVPASAAEVPGVSGGCQGPGGAAGPES